VTEELIIYLMLAYRISAIVCRPIVFPIKMWSTSDIYIDWHKLCANS